MIKNSNDLIFKTSEYITTLQVSENKYAVWNRYFPQILFLNKDSITLLDYLKKNTEPYSKFKGFKRIIKKFYKNKLLYTDKDDCKEKYIKSADENVNIICKNFDIFQKEKLQYNEFLLVTNKCNLKCPYCICEYIKEDYTKDSLNSNKEKVDRILKCIDQNLNSKLGKRKLQRTINFNGGEFLLHKETIKQVVTKIKKKYPNLEIEFNINTNGTLIDQETAQFLSENFEEIAFSIDAHEEAHNQSRIYKNNKGSFSDVIEAFQKVQNCRKKKDTSFQGTLIPEHDLSIDKLESMKEYGFDSARLGVDVLNITPAQAKEMAEKCFNLSVQSKDAGIWAKDNFLKSYKSILEDNQNKGQFNFFCNALNIGYNYLFYNVDNETVKLLCSFCAGLEVKLEDIDNNIHHPELYAKAKKFIQNRYNAIKKNCMDCPIISFCKGGCVMTGIDPFNQFNQSACTFQLETWNLFLKYLAKNN
jgi:radical SAM protein with 4Fe4S-binding SPASM domain